MAEVSPNTSAEVTLAWADGEYKFALKIKQCDELQRILGNWGDIVQSVLTMRPSPRSVYEIIRLGLIGGGTDDVKAKQLVDLYVDGRPLFPSDSEGKNIPGSPGLVALAVISAVQFGVEDFSSKKEGVATTASKGPSA